MRHIDISAAVLIAAAGLAGHAAAQDRPAAYINAETCLVQNVDAAVAASSGAADAAEFLLGYLCAGPVAAASRYELNSDLLASGRGLVEGFLTVMPAGGAMADMPDFGAMSEEEIEAWMDAQEAAAVAVPEMVEAADGASAATDPAAPPADPFAGISVDPVTGEIVTGDNAMGPMIVAFMDYMDVSARAFSGAPPVFLREMAADLIVARRR